MDQDELLVTFDISSLFTDLPTDEAVQVIHEMLVKNETLGERTTFLPDRIADLGDLPGVNVLQLPGELL